MVARGEADVYPNTYEMFYDWDICAGHVILTEAGGTVTHHHAVGRMHRPGGYDDQRPELFATALRAAKRALDPNGILNPGVLIDP